ncbi:MAG: Zn-dependent exopeptidase M28 [Chloroflexi bacterium]|nr:Zn-dependent exopeptidase M28 [Chloroflexota bacterium]
MKSKQKYYFLIIILGVFAAACSDVSSPLVINTPGDLRFSGERALELETEFVSQFPNRDSGQPNNRWAAEWLHARFTSLGLDCAMHEWQVVNYSQPVPLQNVVCRLAAQSAKEIVIVAHHDQSPDTIYGADNDGSGIAIMLHLAEIFSSEETPQYTLVFLSSDGEEYGMLGTGRFIETHADVDNIIAGISLDNLGKQYYGNLEMSPVGQFRNYGSLWLQRTTQEAARVEGDLWVPPIRSILDQVLNQAVPISFMDQGPLVAAGVPALGFAGIPGDEYREDHWETYHNPGDTLDLQSAEVLFQSGRIPEALIRQLLSMETFPDESSPYLYFESSGTVLKGLPLWLLFITFTSIFFAGAYFKGGKFSAEKFATWRKALPHFLGIWLPLVASLMLTYLLVFVGLMDEYHLYPGTAKNAVIFEPRWPAFIIFLVGTGLFLYLGRRITRRYSVQLVEVTPAQINSLALLIVGLAAFYILVNNPFSLLFLVPILAWLLISGRRGRGKLLDVLLFAIGGLVFYALFYFFGFLILRNDWAVAWFLLMMFSIRMISFQTAAMLMAIIAAGLSMVINPVREG